MSDELDRFRAGWSGEVGAAMGASVAALRDQFVTEMRRRRIQLLASHTTASKRDEDRARKAKRKAARAARRGR